MNDRRASKAWSPIDGASVATAEEGTFENEGGALPIWPSVLCRAALAHAGEEEDRMPRVGVLGLERRTRKRAGGRQAQGASAAATKVRHYMSSG
jgi:hypothetical protein